APVAGCAAAKHHRGHDDEAEGDRALAGEGIHDLLLVGAARVCTLRAVAKITRLAASSDDDRHLGLTYAPSIGGGGALRATVRGGALQAACERSPRGDSHALSAEQRADDGVALGVGRVVGLDA